MALNRLQNNDFHAEEEIFFIILILVYAKDLVATMGHAIHQKSVQPKVSYEQQPAYHNTVTPTAGLCDFRLSSICYLLTGFRKLIIDNN